MQRAKPGRTDISLIYLYAQICCAKHAALFMQHVGTCAKLYEYICAELTYQADRE